MFKEEKAEKLRAPSEPPVPDAATKRLETLVKLTIQASFLLAMRQASAGLMRELAAQLQAEKAAAAEATEVARHDAFASGGIEGGGGGGDERGRSDSGGGGGDNGDEPEDGDSSDEDGGEDGEDTAMAACPTKHATRVPSAPPKTTTVKAPLLSLQMALEQHRAARTL